MLTLEKLAEISPERACLIATASVRGRASGLAFPLADDFSALTAELETLIVVGGGTLIDRAKIWRAEHAPATRLIAIPSVWGSGAEVSPVAVANQNGAKEIHIGERYVPDDWCVWPELAESLPESLARYACGDSWAHALEGFLSPLADEPLREELAALIRELQGLPIANDPRWFEASARACAGQARSSVGLVHGIAHTLEGPLRAAYPDAGWGHARLCALFLWPVMAFNGVQGDKWQQLAARHRLDGEAIFAILRELHEPEAYRLALPLLESNWLNILRDPCTRTNSALVRPANRSFFTECQFR